MEWLVTWWALPVSYVQEEDGATVQKRCPGRGFSTVPPAEHLAAVLWLIDGGVLSAF